MLNLLIRDTPPAETSVAIVFLLLAVCLNVTGVQAQVVLPVSRFAGEMDRVTYPPADTPAKPPLLRWTLSPRTVYAFDYSQKVEATKHMGNTQTRQSMDANGTMLVLADGAQSAILLQDVKAKVRQEASPGKAQETDTELPPVTLSGLQDNGRLGPTDSSLGALFGILFPLPEKPLGIGEAVDVPTSMPVDILGASLAVKGNSHITLSRYVKVEGRTCARLEADVYLHDLDLPTEVQNRYNVQTHGKAIAYFDMQQGAFVSAELALSISLRLQMPSPSGTALPGPKAKLPSHPPTVLYVSDTDNLITLKRNAAKANAAH